MRERHPYDPSCPDCIPAIINTETGEVLPREHPTMVKILKHWYTTPFIQRGAFIAVTVYSSTDADDRRNADPILDAISRIVKQATSN